MNAKERLVKECHEWERADWHLDTAAERLRVTRDDFVLRLERAGFGYFLTGKVRDAARKSRPAPLRLLL